MKTAEIIELSSTQTIAKHFCRAADQYDKNAYVQKQIALRAINILNSQVAHCKQPALSSNVLDVSDRICADLGCGTGFHIASISENVERYVGVDISANMLKQASQRVTQTADADKQFSFVNASAQRLPFSDNTIDHVYSSMALQWCDSPNKVMQEIARVIKANGTATLAIMVKGSFCELDNAWRSLDMPSRVNQFASVEDWLTSARLAGFESKWHTAYYHQWFECSLDMLRSIRAIGANTSTTHKTNTRLSKHELGQLDMLMTRQFADNMHRYQDIKAGLPLSYKVSFLELSSTR